VVLAKTSTLPFSNSSFHRSESPAGTSMSMRMGSTPTRVKAPAASIVAKAVKNMKTNVPTPGEVNAKRRAVTRKTAAKPMGRPLRKRLRLVGSLALQDHRKVLAVYPQRSKVRNNLIKLGAVVYDSDHGVLGRLSGRAVPCFAQRGISAGRARIRCLPTALGHSAARRLLDPGLGERTQNK
jgi:hypothetical protein